MQWPRVRKDDDDGQMNTHFAYQWSPETPISAIAVAMGNLPEMHVWVGLIKEQEIVDFSTRHLKTNCAMTGMEWTADDPPQYLWCPANDLPHWVGYLPNADASLLACALLKKLYKPAYIK